MKKLGLLFSALAVIFFLSGCGEETPGEKVDNAVEKAGDKIENATDKAADKIEQAGDKIEEKTDK